MIMSSILGAYIRINMCFSLNFTKMQISTPMFRDTGISDMRSTYRIEKTEVDFACVLNPMNHNINNLM
jgi:hypothetical protein